MINAHIKKTFSTYSGMKKEPPTQPFNRALFYFLTAKKVTFAKIIEQTGLSQGYISHLKNGEYEGKESTRRKIADVCGYDGSGPGKNYDDFINLGQSLVLCDGTQKPDRAPVHSDAKIDWRGEVSQPKPEYKPNKSDAAGNKKTETKAKLEPIRQQHVCLIDLFPDQEEAYELNKKLLEIKKHAPERFEDIKDMVEVFHKKLDLKKIAGENSE